MRWQLGEIHRHRGSVKATGTTVCQWRQTLDVLRQPDVGYDLLDGWSPISKAWPPRPPATRQRNQGPGASPTVFPGSVVRTGGCRLQRQRPCLPPRGPPRPWDLAAGGHADRWSGQLRRSSVKRRRRRVRRPGCTLRAPKRRHSGTTTAQRAPFETTVVARPGAVISPVRFRRPSLQAHAERDRQQQGCQAVAGRLAAGAVLVTPRDGALGRREHVRGEVEQRGRPKPHDRPLGSTTITGAITSRPPLRCLKRIACFPAISRSVRRSLPVADRRLCFRWGTTSTARCEWTVSQCIVWSPRRRCATLPSKRWSGGSSIRRGRAAPVLTPQTAQVVGGGSATNQGGQVKCIHWDRHGTTWLQVAAGGAASRDSSHRSWWLSGASGCRLSSAG